MKKENSSTTILLTVNIALVIIGLLMINQRILNTDEKSDSLKQKINQIESQLKELQKISLKKDFWKDKNIVKKTVKQKKIFEDILVSYKKSFNDLNNPTFKFSAWYISLPSTFTIASPTPTITLRFIIFFISM